jgi:cobalt/nickel transport system permease protein
MHISEGVLSLPVLAGGGVVAIAGIAVGLKRMNYDNIMTTALLSSAFFVATLVHVPVGPVSVHLLLNGLLGMILGWGCIPAIAIALFLQTLLFQYGGLTVLGVNVVIMAGSGMLAYFLFGSWLKTPGKKRTVGAFLGGALAVLAAAFFMAIALISSGEAFLETAKVVALTHIPIMLIEGVITMFTVNFIGRVQPEILTDTAN